MVFWCHWSPCHVGNTTVGVVGTASSVGGGAACVVQATPHDNECSGVPCSCGMHW